MEGPTPVSALIHAATMVTAGVYLLVRASPIFEAAPDVQHLAAILGAITLLVAGVIALVQWDIKRVIAYSTMSQIGYMFMAAGIGAYGYAIFHLMTHAFFKALLFMTAGLVIHHLDGEQDIRQDGRPQAVMPRTHVAFARRRPRARWGSRSSRGSGRRTGSSRRRSRAEARSATRCTSPDSSALCLTGLYTSRLYFAVFRGEQSEFVKEHAHEGHGEGPLLDARSRSASSPCSRRSAGWSSSQASGSRSCTGSARRPNRSSSRRWPRTTARARSPSRSASSASTSPGARSTQGRQLVTSPGIWRVLEHKLYFDEAYDALFYRPAAALSVALRRNVEEPRRRALSRRDRRRDDPGRR